MNKDYIVGIGDGIDGTFMEYGENLDSYKSGYAMGRRIVGGSKGLTIRELNIIKLLKGFALSDAECGRLKQLALDVINQHGDFEEEFILAEEYSEYI